MTKEAKNYNAYVKRYTRAFDKKYYKDADEIFYMTWQTRDKINAYTDKHGMGNMDDYKNRGDYTKNKSSLQKFREEFGDLLKKKPKWKSRISNATENVE